MTGRKLGRVERALRRDLRELGALQSGEGEVALTLAALLDDPGTSASAASACARELREAMAAVRDRVGPVRVSPLDEIRERRKGRLARGSAS